MAAAEAILYQILANDTRRDEHCLKFASSKDERISLYFHIPEGANNASAVRVNTRQGLEQPAAVLRESDPGLQSPLLIITIDAGLDAIELEARTTSVRVRSPGWTTDPANPKPFTALATSTPTNRVLYLVRPDEPFRIGEREFMLQPREPTRDQEIQVMSSRPSESDELDVQREDIAEPGTVPSDRCSTPTRGSGAAVMETPMANRHQSPVEEERSLTSSIAEDAIKGKEDSQLLIMDPLKREAMTTLRKCAKTDHRSQADPSPELRQSRLADEADLDLPSPNAASMFTKARVVSSDKPNGKISSAYRLYDPSVDPSKSLDGTDVLDRAGNDAASARTRSGDSVAIVMEEAASSQATEASSQSASQAEISNTASLQTPTLPGRIHRVNGIKPGEGNSRKRSAPVDHDGEYPDNEAGLSRVSGLNQESAQQARRKRPRRNSDHQAALKGKDESQNSIRSTIQVEIPHTVLSPDSRKSTPAGIKTRSTPQDSRKHAEPPSSNRSTRSMSQIQEGENEASKAAMSVFYASSTKVDGSTAYIRFLKKRNVKPVKNVNDCDVLCVGKGELKRTSNLILAVLMGKTVVTDQWVVQSAKEGQLLDTAAFIPEDAFREQDWGTSLSHAIERGRQGVKPLQDWTINFTPSAKKELGKSWSELKEICLAGGAVAVQAMIPRKSPAESGRIIVIAASHEPDYSTLEERGWRVYTKDIITLSVLRGSIDALSDEFLVKSTKKVTGSAKKKKHG
ncbi:MAG: hypothetical protein Q9222_002760 [Ikaeria aurantiellina]